GEGRGWGQQWDALCRRWHRLTREKAPSAVPSAAQGCAAGGTTVAIIYLLCLYERGGGTMEEPDFSPARIGLPHPTSAKVGPARKPPRPRRGERFPRGPIPWPWLVAAARVPGQALAVGLFLWHRAGMKKTGKVSLPLARLAPLGLSKGAA